MSDDLERRLADERPVPRAGFRAALGANLRARIGDVAPRRLRLLIAGYAGAGLSLLLVAAVSVAGAGPLAA